MNPGMPGMPGMGMPMMGGAGTPVQEQRILACPCFYFNHLGRHCEIMMHYVFLVFF